MERHCALRLTRRFEAPATEVWDALLDAGSRRRWLGDVGAAVRTIDPGRLLELDLGESVARIELTPDGHATRLVVDHVRIPAAVGMRFMRNWTAAVDRLQRELRA